MNHKTAMFMKQCLKMMIFAFYIFLVIYMTLMNREPEPERMAWMEVFGSYKRAFEESHEFILWGLIDNILMMIPFGFLLPFAAKKCKLPAVLFLAFMGSLAIECTQYVTRLGYFDVDDIINNLWGALIGYGLFVSTYELICAIQEQRSIRIGKFIFGILPVVFFLLFFLIFLKMALP